MIDPDIISDQRRSMRTLEVNMTAMQNVECYLSYGNNFKSLSIYFHKFLFRERAIQQFSSTVNL